MHLQKNNLQLVRHVLWIRVKKQMPSIDQSGLVRLLGDEFPTLEKKYKEQFALLFLELQKKCEGAEISSKALDLRGLLDALRLIRCGVGANRALDMGITNKAFDAYEQSLIRARAFLTSLRGWRSKTRPMKKSCLCAPCSPNCAAAMQRNSSPQNISSPVRSGWRRINPSTRSSLRGGKRCFRRSRRCLPRHAERGGVGNLRSPCCHIGSSCFKLRRCR